MNSDYKPCLICGKLTTLAQLSYMLIQNHGEPIRNVLTPLEICFDCNKEIVLSGN